MRIVTLAVALAFAGCVPVDTEETEEDADIEAAMQPAGGDPAECYVKCKALLDRALDACNGIPDKNDRAKCVSEAAAGYGECMSDCGKTGGCNWCE